MLAYPNYEHEIAQARLADVFAAMEGPVCLIGGWAVFITVNERFSKANRQAYAGSSDIDLGFHVDPAWSDRELAGSAIARSSRILEEAGFAGLGSRFMTNYDIDTKRAITMEQSRRRPLHQIFRLYVDLMGDSPHDGARKVIGFPLLVEPRLSHVFGGESAAAEWLGRRFTLPAPWILAATKLGSVTNRAMGHKKVKDVSDLYAVLEYSEPGFDRIRQKVLENVGADMVASAVASLGDDDYEGASDVCGVAKVEISKSVRALAP